jgi:redox-regulated HSP33 family molecular chaperone
MARWTKKDMEYAVMLLGVAEHKAKTESEKLAVKLAAVLVGIIFHRTRPNARWSFFEMVGLSEDEIAEIFENYFKNGGEPAE